jgi:hypothetical protein
MILTSWGYTYELPVDNDNLLRIGNRAAEAIETVNGRKYLVGPASLLGLAGERANVSQCEPMSYNVYVLEKTVTKLARKTCIETFFLSICMT